MYSDDQNQDSYDQSSSEQKKYFCFCDKLFITYSGLYQHIKSKHNHLFPTYKKMKLQKMLKKSRDSRENYNYKLIKLTEDNIQLDSSFNKNKRNAESSQSRMRKKVINMAQNEQTKPKQMKTAQSTSKQNEQNDLPRNQNNQIFSKNAEIQQKASKQFSDPFMNFSTNMPPYPASYPHFMPHMFPHYPPFYPQFRLTIKGFLVKFLFQSPNFNIEQTKVYLYDLMTFIDKNVQKANDPRIKGRVFLSYCDEYGPQYLGPIITEFIQKLETSFKQNITQYNQEKVENKKLQIDCIKTFGEWLSVSGFVKFQKEDKNQIKNIELHESCPKQKEVQK